MVVLVTKNKATVTSTSLPVPPFSAVNEGGGNQETLDIEMNPNSLYGLTSGSESIVTEVYGVSDSVPSQPATYEYINPYYNVVSGVYIIVSVGNNHICVCTCYVLLSFDCEV